MFILGALTDGYYYMFYMLGALSIARQSYVCNRKCILGTILGFVFGVANIFNFCVFEEIIFFFGDSHISYSIGSVIMLSLSTICLIHMVY